MGIIKLKAYSEKEDWSFYVKEPKSGLLLPVIRNTFSVVIEGGGQGELSTVLHCEIGKMACKDRFLQVALKDGELACEQGKLRTKGKIEINGSLICCTVILDNYSQKEETDAD